MDTQLITDCFIYSAGYIPHGSDPYQAKHIMTHVLIKDHW